MINPKFFESKRTSDTSAKSSSNIITIDDNEEDLINEVRSQFIEFITGDMVKSSTSSATVIRCISCSKQFTLNSITRLKSHISGVSIGTIRIEKSLA